MDIKELPESEHVLTRAERDFLAVAIMDALATMGATEFNFTHFSDINGASRGGRVFFRKAYPGAVPFPRSYDPIKVATLLCDLVVDMVYDPPTKKHAKKGWEIRKALIDGEPVVIAWAAWFTQR